MPTAAALVEPHPPLHDMHSMYRPTVIRDGADARAVRMEQAPGMEIVARHASIASGTPTPSRKSARGLSERIRELIRIEGSASAVADRCGFSEGTVRNWRDGRSDMSRERCITMAHSLGVSLLWLMTGEGPMKDLPEAPAETLASSPGMPSESDAFRPPRLDSNLLAIALRLMQSYMGLIGGSLEPGTRAARIAELYEILSHCGDTAHVGRLMNFHQTLRDQLRHDRALIA